MKTITIHCYVRSEKDFSPDLMKLTFTPESKCPPITINTDYIVSVEPYPGEHSFISGKDYKRHFSLDIVGRLFNDRIGRRIVLCPGNIERTEDILYLPVYMAMFIS